MIIGKLLYWHKGKHDDILKKVVTLTPSEVKLILSNRKRK